MTRQTSTTACITGTALLLLTLSCAGTSNRANLKSSYASDAGTATGADLRDKAVTIFAKLNYQFERFDVFQTRIYIETSWRDRSPFQDEAVIGAQAARTRFIINARERVQKSSSGFDVYKVSITGENEVKFNEDDGWVRLPLTASAEDYIRACITEFKTELNSGLRVY